MVMDIISLKVVDIKNIIFGDRFREDLGAINELVESIKKEGIIQPLAVRENEDGTYLLLAGGRRYTAATKANIEKVPVRCYPPTLSEEEMRSIELMENVCRKDLTWIEKANLSKQIYELQVKIHGEKVSTSISAKGVSKRDVAEMIGKNHATLIKDIQRADAIKIFPELKKAKNANEADKMLGKIQEQMLRSELASRIVKKQADTPIDKIHQTLVNQYIVKDFFDGIKTVPDGSIDFIELDPPYAIDLNDTKRDMRLGYTDNYNEVSKADYPGFITRVLTECNRVMSANSWMIIYHAKEWRTFIMGYLEALDLKVDEAIWYKGTVGQTNSPERHLASCFEPMLYVAKGKPSIIRQGHSNVFSFKPVSSGKKIHPTERPVELTQDVLQTFCWDGARILVPFLGSGNTILAASNLGMIAFGFDLGQAYKDGYIINVTASRPGSYRSYKEETPAI